jgi:hypothetical protein
MPGVNFTPSLKRMNPFLLFGRLISIIVFTFILCAGWAVLSYVKNGVVPKKTSTYPAVNQPTNPSTYQAPVTAHALATSANTQTPLKQPRLVYSCSVDKEYYHALKHVSNQQTRIALSEDAAKERGLKPCICITE